MENYEKTAHYALFNADPTSQPPFTITMGIGDSTITIEDCQDIPDGIEKIKQKCANLILGPDFILLYPIYLEAMNTDAEMTMHNIAWLIKEPADSNGWKFDRIGGYTNKTERDFIALPPNRGGGDQPK